MKVQALFEDIRLPEMEVFRSKPSHFRLKFVQDEATNDIYSCRSEFRVYHDGEECYYVMFEKEEGDKTPKMIRKDIFPVISQKEISSEICSGGFGFGQ